MSFDGRKLLQLAIAALMAAGQLLAQPCTTGAPAARKAFSASQARSSCLSPMMNARKRMPESRIFMTQLMGKIFDKREGILTKRFDMRPADIEYYDNYLKYFPGRMDLSKAKVSPEAEYAAEILKTVLDGKKRKSANRFAEKNYKKALAHLNAHAMRQIDAWLNDDPAVTDMEISAYHISMLIILKRAYPGGELFPTDERFFELLDMIARTSCVTARQSQTEGPFQYGRDFLADIKSNKHLFFNIGSDIIHQTRGLIDSADTEFINHLGLIIEDENYGKLPELSTDDFYHFAKIVFNRSVARMSRESAYIISLINTFDMTSPKASDAATTEAFLESALPDEENISFRQAAYRHLTAHKEKYGGLAKREFILDHLELIAYNISMLIVLRDMLPDIFIREDGKDVFASILQNAVAYTRILPNYDNADSDFQFGTDMLNRLTGKDITEFYFIVAHELGHNILALNKRALPAADGNELWVDAVHELFADLAGLIFLQKTGRQIESVTDLPLSRKQDVIHTPEGQVAFSEPHQYSANQLAVIIKDGFLSRHLTPCIYSLLDIIRNSNFSSLPEVRAHNIPRGRKRPENEIAIEVTQPYILMEAAA